jgi:glyoxylase-like metal-dependent hydrolase (beta-lactamase superfamily II)
VKIGSIILTHSHIDHAGGVEALKRELAKQGEQPVVMGHRNEELMRQSIAQQAVMFGLSPEDYENASEPTRYIDEGDTVQVGRFSAKIFFTPGHAPGHVVLFFGDLPQGPVLIAGDTLFAGSIGRTDFPMADHATLIRSIKTKILTLPEETVVMPGHGPDTTVGEEAQHNPFLMVHG